MTINEARNKLPRFIWKDNITLLTVKWYNTNIEKQYLVNWNLYNGQVGVAYRDADASKRAK